MQLIKIISTQADKVGRRVAKFLRYGKNDTQTALQAGPPGVDANPIKDMIAVYAPTSEKGDTVVIGYINKNQISEPGEYRIFSTNADGQVQATMHLKANGVNQFTGQSVELLGSAKTLAKFEELKAGFDQLKSHLNEHIQHWNTFATAYLPGSPSVLGTPPTAQTSTPSDASVDDSQAANIKTA